MSVELLVFEIDDGIFGIPTRNVREVLRAAALFPLVEHPDFIEGGLDLRGTIIPVIDARIVFSRERKKLSPSNHIIVVDAGDTPIALRVDRAIELTNVDTTEESISSIDGKIVEHVMKTDRGPTSILDIDELVKMYLSSVSTISSRSQA